ncbi:MAG: glycosyltransferase family 2 protein [Anaerolineaceae bacterium]|nr:glycosyltransferase family 2 protein [Anaerolineaceae bacterium]
MPNEFDPHESLHKMPCEKGLFGTVFEPALSVIVPTKNESGNIEMLLTRIEKAMNGTSTEVVFVDDSSDDTPEVICRVSDQYAGLVVSLLHRTPDQQTGGLGGAVIAGMQVAHAPFACVMDGDLQHPPELLPQLLEVARQKQADLVVASRRVAESKVSGLNVFRNLVSRGLDKIARIFFPKQLRGVSDPLTGFFLVRMSALDFEHMQPKGFKILLEILVRNPNLVKAEVPFHFGVRNAGKSKASTKEAIKYFNLLWSLRFGDSDFRFIKFALVGASGILVNSAALALASDGLRIYPLISAAIALVISTAVATVASTTWNFILTEWWVFKIRPNPEGRLKRFVLFFAMNLIALAFRDPIIYVLTNMLGMYLLLSNIISLTLLIVLRYLLADGFIWGKPKTKDSQVQVAP